jgi:glycosyltransferase involved in cell wall biosynthesis
MPRKIVTIVYNTAFYVYKFRMNLIKDLMSQGYDVVVLSPVDEYVVVLQSNGIEHVAIAMSQYGMNPLKELFSTIDIYKKLKRISPVCSLHYTIKPNIFGSLAARMAGVPVVNNIAGAGRAFSEKKFLFARFIVLLYKLGLSKSYHVFFQNNDDMELFLRSGAVRPDIVGRLPGSGVDLKKYSHNPATVDDEIFRFLFVGRLLKEKGIVEYLKAAKLILNSRMDREIHFEVVGELDGTSACIDKSTLSEFLQDKRFIYHGTVSPDVMPAILGNVDCVVLPSYYGEGVPRSLLEAAALSKAIITTDSVGCREVVDEGVNGFKVPVRDVRALTFSMEKILRMTPEELKEMGAAGRKKVVKEFDEAIVLKAYRDIVQSIPSKD